MTEVKRRPTHEEYILGMQEYIERMKNMDKEQAKQKAIENLTKAGILDENGNTKENLVTGDFFGW
jgi:DNA polymerase III alpha subunit